MERTIILGVKLHDRIHTSEQFQKIISEHGCIIKTRIGLHHVENGVCSPSGVILLELLGSDEDINNLENSLKTIPNIEIQKMVFETR